MIKVPTRCTLCGAPWITAHVIEKSSTVKMLVECECMEGHVLICTAEEREIYDWAVQGD